MICRICHIEVDDKDFDWDSCQCSACSYKTTHCSDCDADGFFGYTDMVDGKPVITYLCPDCKGPKFSIVKSG